MDVLDLTEVFKLPIPERLRLAAALWDSVADEPAQIVLTAAQAAELDERYADLLAHPGGGMSWSAAKSQILQSR